MSKVNLWENNAKFANAVANIQGIDNFLDEYNNKEDALWNIVKNIKTQGLTTDQIKQISRGELYNYALQ